MAGSARFGGQIDASGILGDIYESELRNREALAGQAAGRAREEQNALDKDAQSRWQSGEMSDADWLAYARSRVRESAQFPEEKAEWEKVLRESGDMIAVNQAEFAFQQGGSINQLIAFYQGRAKGNNSVAGREAQERLNQLTDQRLSQEITRNVEDIQDQIDAGQARPDALLAYLKSVKGQARPNSDLARSLETDIEQVDDQIAQFGRDFAIADLQHKWQTGAISGDEYAAGMRAAAGAYANTDPSTYFSLLAEAGAGDKMGRFSNDGAIGGGGGGVRGGGGGGVRGSDGPISLSGLNAEWEDRRWRAGDILSQIMGGQTTVTDPGTGEKVDVTTSSGRLWLENVNRDAFSTFAAERRIGTELGDRDMVTGASAGHDQFLLELTQPSNTMLEREAAGYLVQSISNQMLALDNEIDPLAVQRGVNRLADKVDSFVAARTGPRMNQSRARSADGAITGANQEARGEAASLDPAFIGEMSMLSSALRTGQFDPNLNVTSGVGDIINAEDMTKFASDAGTIHDKATGMGTRWTYAVIPGQGVEIVPLALEMRQVQDAQGGAVMTQVPVPDPTIMADTFGIKPGDGVHKPIAIAVQVGGSVMRMNGWSTDEATPWTYWTATESFQTSDGTKVDKGKAIGSDLYNSMSAEDLQSFQDSGVLVRTAYRMETFSAPDANGRPVTYSRLPGGSWVRGAFPLTPTFNADGTIQLDIGGDIKGVPRPVQSVLVPFIGTDSKLAQAAIDSGEYDDIRAETQAVNWDNLDPLGTPFDTAGTFWSQADQTRRDRLGNGRNSSARRTGDAAMVDWWDNKSRGQIAADRWHSDKRAIREAAKQRSEGDLARNYEATNPMRDLFSNEGAGMGVSFGGARMNTNPNDPNKVEQRAPSSWPSSQMPSVNLPRIGSTTTTKGRGFNSPGVSESFLPPRLPSPQASSGPFLSRTAQPSGPRARPATGMSSFLPRMLSLGSRITQRSPVINPDNKGVSGGNRPT